MRPVLQGNSIVDAGTPVDISTLKTAELRHIAWLQLNIRVPASATAGDIHKMLRYEVGARQDHEVNKKRHRLMAYISANLQQLALPCDGNCFNHADGVVLFCYKQFLEEAPSGETSEEERPEVDQENVGAVQP